MEPKGERVGALEGVSTIVCAHLQFTNTRQLKAAEGKRFWGEYRGTTMETNKEKVESQLVQKFSRYTEVINLRVPHRGTASLAQVSTMGLCPLPW